jgi:hypothetical protein
MDENSEFYVLECRVEHCTAEFYINDIPVIRRGQTMGTVFDGPVNHLLVNGTNEIAILLEPGPAPGTAIRGGQYGRCRKKLPENARAAVRLARYPYGAISGGPDAEPLLEAQWLSPENGDPVVLPLVVTTAEDLGPMFGTWAWESAPPLSLDMDTRVAIGNAVSEILHPLDRGDADPFVWCGAPRSEEIEKAFDLPQGTKKAQILMGIIRDAANPWWGMEPLDPGSFDLRLCARNRLVQIMATDWRPALREKPSPSGERSYYDMMLGLLDDQWRILR